MSVFTAVFAFLLSLLSSLSLPSSRLRYLPVFPVFALFSYDVKGCHVCVYGCLQVAPTCFPRQNISTDNSKKYAIEIMVFTSYQEGLSCLCLRLSSRCPNLLPTSLTVDSAGSAADRSAAKQWEPRPNCCRSPAHK